MAMIQCPECNKPMSDSASACPSCGYPVSPPPLQTPKKKGMPGWAIALIIIGCMGVIALPVIGMMAAIAIPAFVKARTSAQRNACINNLRQIDGAKDEYALEYGGTKGMTITWDNITPYIKDMSNRVFCAGAPVPERGLRNYTIQPMGTDPECLVHPEQHRLQPQTEWRRQ